MNLLRKVLHLLNHSYPYADGYAIRSFNIVNAQRRAGMEPMVLTSPKHEPPYTENPEVIEGVTYYRIASRKPARIPFNLYVVHALYRKLYQIYQESPFEILHAHSPSLCGLAAMLFSWKTGIPFVYEVRAFWEDAAVDAGKYAVGSFPYRLTRGVETFVLRRAHAVTTIARYLQADIEIRRGDRENVFLIPNGVDCERFHPIPPDTGLYAEFGITEDDPVIGFIGSFYRFEGLNILLRALAILKAQGVRYKAVLVGGGEMDNEWRALAQELGLSDVMFTGRVAHADVLRYYSVFDLCVYPRLREQITELVTPLKPLEAMAMGKLVIGSDVGGLKELLADGKGGVLFPAENAEKLAAMLREVIEHPAQYEEVIAAGAKIARDQYSWMSFMERYRSIYNTVLS